MKVGLIIRLVILASTIGLCVGCKSCYWSSDKLTSETDKLYSKYLSGDIAQARQSIENAIELVTCNKRISEYDRAAQLIMLYGHLCCIEIEAKDQQAALSAFEKVKENGSKKLQKMDISDAERQEYKDRLTLKVLVENITKSDLYRTNGRGPAWKKEKRPVIQ
jgi:hypothetical protein